MKIKTVRSCVELILVLVLATGQAPQTAHAVDSEHPLHLASSIENGDFEARN